MHFQAENELVGSPEEVAELLVDPDFYRSLKLPDLSQPEVVDSSAAGPRSMLRLRYEFTGNLDSTARRLIGAGRLSWVQELVLDRAPESGDTASGDLTFTAQADPRRLHGRAHFTLESKGAGCVRRLAGELVVAVPLIGSRAERKIVPGVLRRLDIEAEAINQRLTREKSGGHSPGPA